MTLYGVGLGPGDPDLVTLRGRRTLESVDVVYTPGRLSRSVAREHVPAETLGDPNVYSTFGHLRRTLEAFHPAVDVEVVPGVSSVTAFASAFGVEIAAGEELCLREAADGAAPTGPDRMVLFKVTDAPTTGEKLDAAGYDVLFGRRLFMDGETVVTDDPADVADRDYYTLAYAQRRDVDLERVTDRFDDPTGTP